MATSLLFGCSAGVNFKKLDENQLVLGVTTKTEVLTAMGKPNTKGSAVYNGINVDVINYSYAKVGGDALNPGITPARSQGLFFADEILVGKNYSSSFNIDNTYFDVEKAKTIKEGQSKSDVIETLGESRSLQIYPLVNDKEGYAIVYMLTQAKGFKLKQDILIVEFDSNDVVTKSSLTSTGQF
ncbi:MAG: outer membrane protein assembly factor BamE [Candidatus Thiodiazotropha lotti]